jgi:uncharacterized membrane protein YidH (DUF202 family)
MSIFKFSLRLYGWVEQISPGNAMKSLLTNQKSAAIISCILCIPIVCVITLLIIDVEPHFDLFQPLHPTADPYQPDILGSFIALGVFLLVLLSLIIDLIPVVHAMRKGGSITGQPVNIIIAVALFVIIVVILSAIIIDQYPCWMGVPNCD